MVLQCPSEEKALILIIGASKGFGKALAKVVALQMKTLSAHFALFGRDTNGMDHTKACIEEISGNLSVSIHNLDLNQNADKVMKIFTDALSNTIHLTDIQCMYIFHNSGLLSPCMYAHQHTAEAIATSVQVNITSFFALNTSFWSWIETSLQSGNAVKLAQIRVIQISSKAASFALPCLSTYSAAKSARDVYIRNLAAEIGLNDSFKNLDIKFLNWSPGPMETDMMKELRQNDYNQKTDYLKHLDLVTPEESATKLWHILKQNTFESGVTIDVFDV